MLPKSIIFSTNKALNYPQMSGKRPTMQQKSKKNNILSTLSRNTKQIKIDW